MYKTTVKLECGYSYQLGYDIQEVTVCHEYVIPDNSIKKLAIDKAVVKELKYDKFGDMLVVERGFIED